MKLRSSAAVLLLCLLLSAVSAISQLQEPVAPVNIIIDSDMTLDADDVGDHAVLWGLAARGEVKVVGIIASSANDFSAPAMRAIANYYGHPEVPVGAHKGATPTMESSAFSPYTQQITNQFGTPGDTRFNYPDAVTVYRQVLANAPNSSVYIVANGYFQPLRALLQSQPDGISPLTGTQLVAQKVKRFVCSGGMFPAGQEHNFRVDPDAASFVFANWPGEIVSVGSEVGGDVVTGPSPTADGTQDPVKASYDLFGSSTTPAWGQVAVLFAARGMGTNFSLGGFNGQTVVSDSTQSQPGSNQWSQTPNANHSYVEKQISIGQMAAILNPLLQSSSNVPILRSISPTSVPTGSSGQTITLTGTNFFNDSQVLFNGAGRPTTFISRTQLTVQLSSSDLAQAGNKGLSVSNSAEGGWTSNIINLSIFANAPTLSSISPSSASAGSGPITLTATGANFTDTSLVRVNGSNRTTSFISGTQLTATLTTNDLAGPGSLSITVINSSSGSSSGALTFTVTNPGPTLSSISPQSVVAGSAAFTLTVNGSNFVSGSVVQVNGANRTTSFASSTRLTATVPASDVAGAGNLSITVSNPAPGGGTSGALTLTVTNPPPPALTSISPGSVLAGSAGFTLTVNGSNFVSGSVVQVNGSNRATTFISATGLTAAVPASDVANAGNLSIKVFNPAPGGGTSSALVLTVNNPVPSISSVSPNPVLVLGGNFTLTVNGSGFVNGSIVRFDGGERTTTFVSSTQLRAQIRSTDILSIGQHSITVSTPAPGGGISNSATLTVISLLGL